MSSSPTRSSWPSNAVDPIAELCTTQTEARPTRRWRSRNAWRTSSSFGSVGDCYDNAVVEAFWTTLKRELAWIHNTNTWQTRAELRSAVFDYIEGFYNPNRIQRRLGHQSPIDYEEHTAA